MFKAVVATCYAAWKRRHMSTVTSGLWFFYSSNVTAQWGSDSTPTFNTAKFCHTAHGAQYQHESNNMVVIVRILKFSSKFNVDEESGSSVVVLCCAAVEPRMARRLIPAVNSVPVS